LHFYFFFDSSLSSSAHSCITCPEGTFQNIKAVTSYALCPAGTYSNKTGATSIDACQKCAPGIYSTQEGAKSARACMSCPSGKKSPAGWWMCYPYDSE
jgi:hypothetical protein